MGKDEPWYRWYIGMLKDGTYRFIMPGELATAEKYIGSSGGAVFTHAGYLIFAANKRWFDWVDKPYQQQYRTTPIGNRPPHIDVPNIECDFSEKALKWLEENEDKLKEIGGKYYDYIPRH